MLGRANNVGIVERTRADGIYNLSAEMVEAGGVGIFTGIENT